MDCGAWHCTGFAMILALILAPAIVVTDMVTRADDWCEKPKILSHGRCVRRTYQDDSQVEVFPPDTVEYWKPSLLEWLIDEERRRCAGRRCR
jgi:hypothetical protein